MNTFLNAPAHCSECGTLNPQTADGYTDCCNEPACDGPGHSSGRLWETGTIGTDHRHNVTGQVRGCCSGVVERSLPMGVFALSRIS